MTDLRKALEQARTQSGETLAALSDAQPRLVVLLRHFG